MEEMWTAVIGKIKYDVVRYASFCASLVACSATEVLVFDGEDYVIVPKNGIDLWAETPKALKEVRKEHPYRRLGSIARPGMFCNISCWELANGKRITKIEYFYHPRNKLLMERYNPNKKGP